VIPKTSRLSLAKGTLGKEKEEGGMIFENGWERQSPLTML